MLILLKTVPNIAQNRIHNLTNSYPANVKFLQGDDLKSFKLAFDQIENIGIINVGGGGYF